MHALSAVPKPIAGVDEAGRGPLAGAVYAAAVILDENFPLFGLDDSKQLSASYRQYLAKRIRIHARAWAIATASVTEIDKLNILQATLLAMRRALDRLSVQPEEALIDGNQLPQLSYPATAIVQGDSSIPSISAASILAKEARDDYMRGLEKKHPGYGFADHKGYPTKAHLQALNKLGPSPVHRRTFQPVKNLLMDPVNRTKKTSYQDRLRS